MPTTLRDPFILFEESVSYNSNLNLNPSMTLKQQLPQKITFTTGALAFACASWLKEKEGFTFDANMQADNLLNSGAGPEHTLGVRNKYVSWYSSGSYLAVAPYVSTWEEFKALITEPTITIGNYTVDFIDSDGVQVGCTFVPWTTIELLISKRPPKPVPTVYSSDLSPEDKERILKNRPWRYLTTRERLWKGPCPAEGFPEIEVLSNGKWVPTANGNMSTLKYRTKLTIAELQALRNPDEIPF